MPGDRVYKVQYCHGLIVFQWTCVHTAMGADVIGAKIDEESLVNWSEISFHCTSPFSTRHESCNMFTRRYLSLYPYHPNSTFTNTPASLAKKQQQNHALTKYPTRVHYIA